MEAPSLFQGKMQLLYHLISNGHLNDIRLFNAFLDLKIKDFVPLRVRKYIRKLHTGNIYEDSPTLFYFDKEHPENIRTISAPHMITIMLQNLMLKEDDDLLILGAKSGYIATLAHKMAPKGKIKILEANSRIAKITERNIKNINLEDHIEVIVKNPLEGLPELSPWQKILVTGSIKTSRIHKLLKQLDKKQGVLFAPIGEDNIQEYTQILRSNDDFFAEIQLQVRFTPLITQLEIDEFQLITDYEMLEKVEDIVDKSEERETISIKYTKRIIDVLESELQNKKLENTIHQVKIFKSLLKFMDKTLTELKDDKKIKNWKNTITNFDWMLKIFKDLKFGRITHLITMEKSIKQLRNYNIDMEKYQNKNQIKDIQKSTIFKKRLEEIEHFQQLIDQQIQIIENNRN